MNHKKTFDKSSRKTIAKKRINFLFQLAKQNAKNGRFDLADRYVYLARKLSMRYRTPVPNEFKRSYCKHCYSYLLPIINCRIRIHQGKIIIHCNNCQKFTRIPFKNKHQ